MSDFSIWLQLAVASAAIGACWIGSLIGLAISDWRDRRAGREPDRGYWP